MSNDNRQNNSDLAGDFMGFLLMCGVVGGPALLVAWAIFKLMISILF